MVAVLLKKGKRRVVGFSFAVKSDKYAEKTAHINRTGIHPMYQRRKLIGTLMNTMENELRRREFVYLTREALIADGYADAIQRHYKDRIVASSNSSFTLGKQRFFKIRL